MAMAIGPTSYARQLRALGQFIDERNLALVSLTAVPGGFIVIGGPRDAAKAGTGVGAVSFFIGNEHLEPIEERMIRTRAMSDRHGITAP
jgi:hypothetical protein